MEKVILITGASSGIGKEAAKYFAAQGWKVIATMRNPEKETELNQLSNVWITKLDVQDQQTIQTAISAGITKFGKIDVLVNNAGYGQFGIFEATTNEQLISQFEVNVFGVMNTIKAMLPHFRAQKSGIIINISSGAGKFTLPLASMYAASKFALEGFSEALYYELSTLNIQVKIIEPGGTSTNFNKVTGESFAQSDTIRDYDPFLAAAGKMFDGMIGATLVTANDVAKLIYGAATDETDTLRYVIGNEDFMERMAARRDMEDQDYVNFIKNGFEKHLLQ